MTKRTTAVPITGGKRAPRKRTTSQRMNDNWTVLYQAAVSDAHRAGYALGVAEGVKVTAAQTEIAVAKAVRRMGRAIGIQGRNALFVTLKKALGVGVAEAEALLKEPLDQHGDYVRWAADLGKADALGQLQKVAA